MNTYPRETDETQPLDVFVEGERVTTGVEVQVTRQAARPTADGWAAALLEDGDLVVPIAGRDVGLHRVWVRLPTQPGAPVIVAGDFRVV